MKKKNKRRIIEKGDNSTTSWEKFHTYLKSQYKHGHPELTEFVNLFHLFEQTGYPKEGMAISVQELEKHPILKNKLQNNK